MNLLEVKNLNVVDVKTGKAVVKNISFNLKNDSCLAIAGESGSGKSVTCKSIMGINARNLTPSGSIIFNGKELLKMPAADLRKIRGRHIAIIMQNAMNCFDPSCTVGVFIGEVMKEHFGFDRKKTFGVMEEICNSLMLHDVSNIFYKYPHQLSGGMLQRIMTALSLALKPELIIADEPTTALDQIVQVELIGQLLKIRAETGTAMIFVSHDLGVVKKISDTILIMKDGLALEYGTTAGIFSNPQNDYTRYLVTSRKALGSRFRELFREAV
ncbi:MAG: ABC transporter ATP-binding protein [Treponema sp.]|jgi:nickel transport system ATP-binding protein|nr:ABC transporter ATP-binding protein [Treponema sp.]